MITTPSGTRFDTTTLSAAADTEITVDYLNQSPNVHNIHFFAGEDATAETLAASEGEAGPDVTQTVTFVTPAEPGEYYFQCDFHPVQMNGVLIVRAGSGAGGVPPFLPNRT